MQRTITIPGVGDVEVGPEFESMSPDQQEATVNEIIAAKKGSAANPKPNEVKVTTAQGGFLTGDTPTPDAGPPKRSVFTPEEEREIFAFVEDGVKNKTLTAESYQKFLQDISGGELGSPDPETDVKNFYNKLPDRTEYGDTAEQNKANDELQKQLAANPERFNDAATFGVNLADGALLNFGAELAAGDTSLVETLNPFDSKSGNFWNNYKGNYAEASALMEQMAQEDPLLAATGNIIGSTVGPTARIGIGNPGWKVGAVDGGITGGLAGLGAGEGSLYERLDEGAIGAAIGTPLGATVGAIAPRATSGRRDELWLNNQIEKNPYAAYDAEIVEDLGKLVSTTAKSPTDPKGRAPVTVKEINNLEQSYLGRFKEKVDKLDIAPSQKLQIKEFLDGKYSLDQTNIDLLRGTPEGDAVADGITKVQRLRALTPEIKKYGFGAALKELISGASAIGAGAGTGSPLAMPAGYGLAKYLLQRQGNTEAARVNAAENLLDKAKRYQMLGERVGPSGAMESKQTFDNLVNENLDGTWMAKKAKEAEARDAALVKSIYGGEADPLDQLPAFLKGTVKPSMSNASKLVRQQESAAAKLQKELDGIDKKAAAEQKAAERGYEKGLKAETKQVRSDFAEMAKKAETAKTAAERLIGTSRKKAEGWQTKFDKATTPKPVKVDPKDAAIQKNIEEGFEGTSRVQQSFAERVGVPEADMLRALDQVAGEFPELADDIKRIQFKYPTKTRGLADILVPRMKAVLEQDGTMAKVKAQAEQATAREQAMRKLANPAKETAPAPQEEIKIGYDNPGGDWLERAKARTLQNDTNGKLTSGSQTAYTKGTVDIPTSKLSGLKGAMDEDPKPGEPKYDALMEKVKAEGWQQDKYPILIRVNQKGEAYIMEGNNRARVAADLGIPNVKAEIQWINGGETVSQDWSPTVVRSLRNASSPSQPPPTRAAEGDMVGISRPQQWAEGKSRNQAQADAAISSLYQDITIPEEAYKIIGNAPDQIKNNFKTVKSAQDYIDEVVMPDLEIAGIPLPEQRKIKAYLYEVAQAKTYFDDAAYEAGTKKKQ